MKILLGVIAIKLVVLAADSTIRIYLGDSAAYLYGAMDNGRMPDDRSFTYSLLIRALVVPFDTLRALAIWQTAAGVAVAMLASSVLVRWFDVRQGLAAAAAVLIALEPAQLYYERMVLTETFGLLAFVTFFAAAGAYLTARRIYWLLVVALTGLLAVTLRVSYLPIVLVICIGLPMLPLLDPSMRSWRLSAAHTLVASVVVAGLHITYCLWVAAIFSVPPGYLARAGFMQLGLVAPLLTPEHFARVGLPPDFASRLEYPLHPDARMRHMWSPGGLTRELREQGVNVELVARELSRMALRDNPLGLVWMGLHTVGNYFTDDGIEHALHNDLGRRTIPDEVLWTLRETWKYDATGLPTRVTPVSRYFELGTWWLVACLFLLLPLSLVNLAVHWRTPHRTHAVLAALFGIGLVLSHVLFVNVAFYRYLHPLPFFVVSNGVGAAAVLWQRHRGSVRDAPA